MQRITDTHYTKKGLKARGWTDRLIERFLGLPDDTQINLMHKSGPPVCLYEKDRVHSAESQPEFIDLQQKRAKRRQAAQQAVETKKAKLRQQLDAIEIIVPEMDEETLTRRAVDHYNAFRFGSDRPLASIQSDADFLNRIRVNYLRHELTKYEELLRSAVGKVGAADAYVEIKEKVLDAIAEVYPYLAYECYRQAQQVNDNWLHSWRA